MNRYYSKIEIEISLLRFFLKSHIHHIFDSFEPVESFEILLALAEMAEIFSGIPRNRKWKIFNKCSDRFLLGCDSCSSLYPLTGYKVQR